MTAVRAWSLAILGAGNLLLWGSYLAERQSRSFDFDAMQAATVEAYGDAGLAPFRFAQAHLLPPQYLYLARTRPEHPLLSAYLGYYPRRGLLEGTPHDPELCYRSFGWDVEDGPEPVAVGDGSGDTFLQVERMLVRKGDHRRLLLYWLQRGGREPGAARADTGWPSDLWDRIRLGRSDMVWVRLEFDPAQFELPLTETWAARIRAHARAIAAALH